MAATPAGGWPNELRPTFADMLAGIGVLAGALAAVRRYQMRRREERRRRQLEREALLAACEALGAVLEILDEPLSTLLPEDRQRRIAVARHEMNRAAREYRTALGRDARQTELLGLDDGPRRVVLDDEAERVTR